VSSNTAVAAPTDIKRFHATLTSKQTQSRIRAILPKNVSIDRFTATTMSAISHNIELLKADSQSLFNSIVKCASDGLLPDGNDAVLNVYNTNIAPKNETPRWVKKVQYQRMVGGIIKQFAKAGINAYAVSVYQNDAFRLWNNNDGQHVEHEPVTFGDRGPMVGVLAVAKLSSGLSVVETMNLDDIERARAASKSGDSGPWKLWYDRMAQKSVLHRLRRRVAIINDDAAQELSKIDDEFDEQDMTAFDPETGEITPENEAQPDSKSPTTATPDSKDKVPGRPKSLQRVVEKGGDEPQDNDVV
jgi:recombination protein RecT